MSGRRLTDELARRYRSTDAKEAYAWAIAAVFSTTPEAGFAAPEYCGNDEGVQLEKMERMVRLYGVVQELTKEGFTVLPASDGEPHAGLLLRDVDDDRLDLVAEILPAGTSMEHTTVDQRTEGEVFISEDQAFLGRLWETVRAEVEDACKRAGRLTDVFEHNGTACEAESSDALLFDWINSLEESGLPMVEARAAVIDYTGMRERKDLHWEEFLLSADQNVKHQGHGTTAPEWLKGHGWSRVDMAPSM